MQIIWPFVSRKEYSLLKAELLSKEKQLSDILDNCNRYNAVKSFMLEYGMSLLSVVSMSGRDMGVFLWDSGNQHIDFFLFDIRKLSFIDKVAQMQIFISGTELIAEVIEFQCNEKGLGYGSVVMECAIRHLRRMGYQKLVGNIEIDDFYHEDELRRFYKKFKFQITDIGNSRRISLDLQDKARLNARNIEQHPQDHS